MIVVTYILNVNEIIQLDEDDDVYELVEESKYAELVENRRKGGDFVVDDSKCI